MIPLGVGGGGVRSNAYFYGTIAKLPFKAEHPSTSSLLPLTMPGLVVTDLWLMVDWTTDGNAPYSVAPRRVVLRRWR